MITRSEKEQGSSHDLIERGNPASRALVSLPALAGIVSLELCRPLGDGIEAVTDECDQEAAISDVTDDGRIVDMTFNMHETTPTSCVRRA